MVVLPSFDDPLWCLVIVRRFSHHVPIGGGGLDRPSFAMPEYVRSIVARRLQRRLGAAEPASVAEVADWLRRIADL